MNFYVFMYYAHWGCGAILIPKSEGSGSIPIGDKNCFFCHASLLDVLMGFSPKTLLSGDSCSK